MILIARVSPAIDSAGTVRTMLFGSVDWTTGPADTPANEPVRGRLVEGGNYKRDLGAGQSLFGQVRPSYGVAKIRITGGALDALARYGWGWRTYELWGYENDGYQALPAFPSGWTLLFSAVVESAQCSESELTLTLKDPLALLTKPVCTQYGGTGGLDGIAAMAGTAKPRLYGMACNVQPVLLDSTTNIYQLSDKTASQARWVYDRRVALTPTSNSYNDAVDFPALQALAVAAGAYARCADAGIFKLNSTPAGALTVDGIRHSGSYATAYGRSRFGEVVSDIATDAGLTSGQVDSALTAIDTAGGASLGYYVRDLSTTYLDVLGVIAASRGAWVGCNRLGQLTGAVVTAPSGSPVWTFRPGNSLTLARVDGAYPVPLRQATVRGGRNWTPMQASDLAGSVPATDLERLRDGYGYAEVSTGSAAAQHLNAPDEVFETSSGSVGLVSPGLPGATVGVTASSIVALFGVARDTIEVSCQLTTALLAAVDLGSVVRVQWPRFNLDAGKLMRCIGVRLNFGAGSGRATFVLWG